MSYKIQQRGAFFMDAGDATAESILWQYGLWSFQGTKLERFFPRNQHKDWIPKKTDNFCVWPIYNIFWPFLASYINIFHKI